MSIFEWLNKPESGNLANGGGNAIPEADNIPPAAVNLAEASSAPAAGSITDQGQESLEEAVIAALRTVYDPEIPVNIYDLGLIYGLAIDPESRHVEVEMTLTAPGCPVAQTFPAEVERRVAEVPGVNSARVSLVWEPPWTRDRMSEAAQLTLGML